MQPHVFGPLLVALAITLLAAAPKVVAQDRHPIAAQVAAAVKDPTKPFTLAISLKVKDGTAEKFEAAFARAIEATRKEKGALAYDLNRDPKAAGRYLVYERWKTLADLEAHLASEHLKALGGVLGEVLDGSPEVRVLVPAGE